MDATIMPSTRLIISQLKINYPSLSFVSSDHFRWSAATGTIYFNANSHNMEAFCLHELSHAILEHTDYSRDIDLLKLERDAWEYAADTLASLYNASIPESLVQESLDTYRNWLHTRSSCPICQATGVQINKHTYKCLACTQNWTVNEARLCSIRRHIVKTPH